jgi:predicted SPOUT superfamily RNA methylase MTH1
MSEQYFLVNKVNAKVILFQGYTTIDAYGFIKISQEQASDPTVLYALGRDWVEITTEEPKAAVKEEVSVTVTEPYRGMTEAELKSSDATPSAEPGITTALGQDSTVEVKPEAPHKATKKKAA